MLHAASAGSRRVVSAREPLPAIRHARPGVCLRYAFLIPAALHVDSPILRTYAILGLVKVNASEWRANLRDSDGGEYMTAGEARDYLGVSKPKMTQLLRDGVLHAEIDPLNRHFKWIRRAEVEALKAQQKKNAA